MRRRGAPGFADPDADAAGTSCAKFCAKPHASGEQAPQTCCRSDDPRPIARLGKARDRNTEHGIEKREGEPRHHAKLPVGKVQLILDRLGEDRDDLPVEEIEDIDDQQNRQRVATVRRGYRRDDGRGGGFGCHLILSIFHFVFVIPGLTRDPPCLGEEKAGPGSSPG
jgi:hypothetical protein